MGTRAEELRRRTTTFALRVLKLFRSLPNCPEARVMGNQLLCSGTSVAANYRAACRARSRAEFLFKLGIVEEEADETVFWLEFLTDASLVAPERLVNLIAEAKQLTAIFVASRRTVKRNNWQLAVGNRQSRRAKRHD